MAKKQRGKTGRLKSTGPNPNKRAERQTRKALRAQRRGKSYSDKDLKNFNSALANSGLVLREMKGDGNCFFRAISDQLEGNQHGHGTYRARVCDHMEEMREFYAPFIEDEEETFDEYMVRMRTDCEWVSSNRNRGCAAVESFCCIWCRASFNLSCITPQAGQPELQAMATVCNVDIMVHQFEAPSYVVSGSTAGKMIHVSYHDGQHYNSVHPTAAAAASLARPAAPNAAHSEPADADVDGDATPEGVYARAVAALAIEGVSTVPSTQALTTVCSVLEDMGGDSDAAHEFLLVDPNFSALCIARPEPEPEPQPALDPKTQTESSLLAPSAETKPTWSLAEQVRFEAGLASFKK